MVIWIVSAIILLDEDAPSGDATVNWSDCSVAPEPKSVMRMMLVARGRASEGTVHEYIPVLVMLRWMNTQLHVRQDVYSSDMYGMEPPHVHTIL